MIKWERVREIWSSRPWWLNLIWIFCLYMTFIYMPFDFFTKPFERWEEVWFGFTLTGWAAKLTEPVHWAIYAAGSFGIWKMKSWMWPWAAVYSAQIVIAMAVFNVIAGPEMGDGRGGGPATAVVATIFFLVPTILLYRAKSLFQEKSDA
ncbi:MAG: uncharacterized membrane protein (DUF2068 family) [Candidatus Azotimanducaceae bacterium]|jgi:uncharacterized membrane protein (DUF2068 family)